MPRRVVEETGYQLDFNVECHIFLHIELIQTSGTHSPKSAQAAGELSSHQPNSEAFSVALSPTWKVSASIFAALLTPRPLCSAEVFVSRVPQ